MGSLLVLLFSKLGQPPPNLPLRPKEVPWGVQGEEMFARSRHRAIHAKIAPLPS